MKHLSTYFTIQNNKSNKILLFDVDDTLINTTACIWVVKNGRYIKKLTNSEYNDYKLGPGESFDLREFEDKEILFKETLTKYWYTLKREYNKGTHIGIITARGNCEMIRDFIKKNGIDIHKSLVFATDDPKLGLMGTVQQRKAEVIARLYNMGYRLFVFFDDNLNNLRAAKSLERIYDDATILIKKV